MKLSQSVNHIHHHPPTTQKNDEHANKISIQSILTFHQWVNNEIMKKSKRKSKTKKPKPKPGGNKQPNSIDDTNPTPQDKSKKHKKGKGGKKSKDDSEGGGPQDDSLDPNPNEAIIVNEQPQSSSNNNRNIPPPPTLTTTTATTTLGVGENIPPNNATTNKPPMGGDVRKVAPETLVTPDVPPLPPNTSPAENVVVTVTNEKAPPPRLPSPSESRPLSNDSDSDDFLEIHHQAPVLSRRTQMFIWAGVAVLLLLFFAIFVVLGYYLSFKFKAPPLFTKKGNQKERPPPDHR